MEDNAFVEKLLNHIDASDEWTEASLAVAAGKANSTIRKWREGKAGPSLKSAEEICAAMGTTYCQFMGEISNGDGVFEITQIYDQLNNALKNELLEKARSFLKAQTLLKPNKDIETPDIFSQQLDKVASDLSDEDKRVILDLAKRLSKI